MPPSRRCPRCRRRIVGAQTSATDLQSLPPAGSNLTALDRLVLGLSTLFMRPRRIPKLSAIIKPATLLKFHQTLVDGKYRRLLSSAGRPWPSAWKSTRTSFSVCSRSIRSPRASRSNVLLECGRSRAEAAGIPWLLQRQSGSSVAQREYSSGAGWPIASIVCRARVLWMAGALPRAVPDADRRLSGNSPGTGSFGSFHVKPRRLSQIPAESRGRRELRRFCLE